MTDESYPHIPDRLSERGYDDNGYNVADQARRDAVSDHAHDQAADGVDLGDNYLVCTILARLDPNGRPYSDDGGQYVQAYVKAYLDAAYASGAASVVQST